MDERERAALQEVGNEFNARSEEEQNMATAIIAAYRAGKAAGEKKAAAH